MSSMRPAFVALLLAASCARGSLPGETPRPPASLVPATAILYGEVDIVSIGQSSLLADELLARHRDRVLARMGILPADAQRATAPAPLASGAAAAYVPGLA